VTVSAQAQALSREAAQMDTAKVERLRSAIQAGTFKVDAKAIAKRIVDGA
jgi:flagellar biosynthesis anti-sigma factor FlgM